VSATGVADGASPAVVSGHPFSPERQRLGVSRPWYGLCGHQVPDGHGRRPCRLSEAAHDPAGWGVQEHPLEGRYRCPVCVEAGVKPCPHQPAKPEREARPEPLPVAEVDLSEMEEHVVTPDTALCDQCGQMMQRTGSCFTCAGCGNNTGCG